MHDSVTRDLSTLLEAEAGAIMAGQYAVIDDLAPRKAGLFDALHKQPPVPDDLRRIAAQLARNKALLAAAIRGIGAARMRLANLRAVRDGLQVYDQTGRLAAVPVTRPDLVKKA